MGAVAVCGGCTDDLVATLPGVAAMGLPAAPVLERPAADVDPALVRAPRVFQATGVAVWNGMRTVRGIWVAHPKVRGPLRVRVVNAANGSEVDGVGYRSLDGAAGDVVIVSSDAAGALGMVPGAPARVGIFALRPKQAEVVSAAPPRRLAETRAQAELSSHIASMDHDRLLQVVAASMRGMGYATDVEAAPSRAAGPQIRAFARPDRDRGQTLPSIRILVRPGSDGVMTAVEVLAAQARLTGSGDIGVVVSVPGFASDAGAALDAGGAHLELVDLDGLIDLWLIHYDHLPEADKDLLRLRPVYFLASG